MNLFDEIIEPYSRPKEFNEPLFGYLNKSTRSEIDVIRNFLEDCYKHYPEESQTDLRSRFRSNNDQQHRGAFFELYCFKLLLRCNFSVEVHQDMNSGIKTHPDFHVYRNNTLKFYCESTITIGSSSEISGVNRIKQDVVDVINRLNSPDYFIMINFRNISDDNPSPSRMRRFIKGKIGNTTYEKIIEHFNNTNSLPIWHYSRDGWEIEFIPIPKKNAARGKPGRIIGNLPTSNTVKLLHDDNQVRSSLKAKATKYGELNKPYIIAINCLSPFIDDIDIILSLFGNEKLTLDGNNQPIEDFNISGLWLHNSGVQNTRVSAVLVLKELEGYSIAKKDPILWHNPWAQHPLDPSDWQGIQIVYDVETSERDIINGKKGYKLLNLDQAWPKV